MRGARVGGQLGGGPVFPLGELFQTDEPATAVRDLVLETFGAETAADGSLEPVPYLSGSPATGALYRLRGTTTDGEPWSLFCKVLQHVRHWPMMPMLPPSFAADMIKLVSVALPNWTCGIRSSSRACRTGCAHLACTA